MQADIQTLREKKMFRLVFSKETKQKQELFQTSDANM